MKISITAEITPKRRATYYFAFVCDWTMREPKLLLDTFTIETKEANQRKWRLAGAWSRTCNRDNKIQTRPIPPSWVVTSARTEIANIINAMPLSETF